MNNEEWQNCLAWVSRQNSYMDCHRDGGHDFEFDNNPGYREWYLNSVQRQYNIQKESEGFWSRIFG